MNTCSILPDIVKRLLPIALALFSVRCIAQNPSHDFPRRLDFARHTFFDFGPPFDFYEVLQVTADGDKTHVARILVTPPGDTCLQPPTIETKEAVLNQSIKELLNEKDPCSISEKSLRKELKRCKHCSTFSGENVILSLSCGAVGRRFRMDILDRDLFDSSQNTPQHTSWTMGVLAKLDQALGPGVWDKPAFLIQPTPPVTPTSSAIIQKLANGEFDDLFDSKKRLSEYYHNAQTTQYPPAVEIVGATPRIPANIVLPIYPPIAKAAHVEGVVTVHFVISAAGTVTDISVIGEPKMFESSIKDTLSQWHFPVGTESRQGDVTFRFQLNCRQP